MSDVVKINDFNSFLETVKAFLYNSFPDCRIEETTATKNNNVRLTGISVRPQGSKVAPTVYMESYFAEYQGGKPLSVIFGEIAEAYKKALEGDSMRIDPGLLNDFGYVKDKICFTLVNRELNTKLLATAPHRDYHGLAITYYVLLAVAEGSMGTITVTSDLMQLWSLNEEQLYELASHNTPILNHGCVVPLIDEIGKIIGLHPSDDGRERFAYKDFDIVIDQTENTREYYASTVNQARGSCIILYPELLEEMGKKIGNFFALPSTIHEFIFAPGELEDSERLSRLVKRINATNVPPDEILSGSCFYYDAKARELKEIG